MGQRHTVYSILSISLVGLSINLATVVQAAPMDAGRAGPMTSMETDAASTPTVCNLPHARIQRSSPAIGDLDNDGVKEIVVGGSDGYLYAVNPEDCSAVPGWPKQVNDYFTPDVKGIDQQSPTQDIESSPVVADIDGDGRPEVIATVGWMPQYHQNGGAIVFEHNGVVKSGWPKATLDVHGAGSMFWHPDGYSDGVFSTPAIGDIDGDGDPEIVYGGFDKCIYAWNSDGTSVDGWWNEALGKPARCMPDTIWSSPALADLDGDHVLDIVIGTDSHPDYAGGSVWAFKGNNTELWHVYTTQVMMSSPAVGDINADGYPEIVIGTGTYYPQGYKGITDGYKVYAFDRFGNSLPGWPTHTAGPMYASPALADLNGDGTLEIMIGCGTEVHFDPSNPPADFCNQLYAWHYNGNPVSGYPTPIKRANPWPDGQGSAGMPYGPVLADYDDDGKIDVFLAQAGGWGVSIFQYDTPGSVDISHYLQYSTLGASPVIDTLYNNDNLYMVAAGANSSGTQGAIYIWLLNSSADGDRPWPMFRHNAQRTGRYLMPAHLDAAPDSIYAMHQIGESGSEHATIWLQNLGDADFDWTATDNNPKVTLSPSSGTFPAQDHVEITISTSGLSQGTHNLGTVRITGSADGESIAGSPVDIPVTLYVGEVHKVFLPLTVSH
jgi:hypothetical protein